MIYFEKYNNGTGANIVEYYLKSVRLKAHTRRNHTKRKATK
jgi:hypothetical protein